MPAESDLMTPWGEKWEPTCSAAGGYLHVFPLKGLIDCQNWGLNPYQRRGIAALCANIWRMMTGAYLRTEHPSEKRLERSMTECQAWCEVENRREASAAAALARLA